jgi:hypothetical protein
MQEGAFQMHVTFAATEVARLLGTQPFLDGRVFPGSRAEALAPVEQNAFLRSFIKRIEVNHPHCP